MIKSIHCPGEYDFTQYQKDEKRLSDLHSKSITPRLCLTGAEIAEQDQLMTRTTVFRRTPEGMARIPSYKKETLPAEEEKELSHLKSFCKVTPIWAGKPTVVCDDPVVIAHPKFNPGTW